jgi:two-component sensor histidine kinase
LDEILTVSRLGLPAELRRPLACTDIIENMIGHRASRHPQREALEFALDGLALDCRGLGFGPSGVHAVPRCAGYSLSVLDDGPGVPSEFDPARRKGLGTKLVLALVKQIRGELKSTRR